jgi:hypothetical protein
MRRVAIRFNGDGDDSSYWIKLGPIENPSPPEREFRGGDRFEVILVEREDKPDVVDLTFSDGVAAYEVPRDFFTILS